jgi:plasmid stabilization system protein ParE
MQQFTVKISLDARQQITEQMLYIAQDSIDRAYAWETRVTTAISSLGSSPGYSRDEAASNHLGREVRRLVFERTYLILFTVDVSEGVVEVIGFRHGMRLPKAGEP